MIPPTVGRPQTICFQHVKSYIHAILAKLICLSHAKFFELYTSLLFIFSFHQSNRGQFCVLFDEVYPAYGNYDYQSTIRTNNEHRTSVLSNNKYLMDYLTSPRIRGNPKLSRSSLIDTLTTDLIKHWRIVLIQQNLMNLIFSSISFLRQRQWLLVRNLYIKIWT